jgi:hypothetical protein
LTLACHWRWESCVDRGGATAVALDEGGRAQGAQRTI